MKQVASACFYSGKRVRDVYALNTPLSEILRVDYGQSPLIQAKPCGKIGAEHPILLNILGGEV